MNRAFPFLLFAAVLLTGCGPSVPPAPVAKADPTTEAWYGQTTERLTKMDRGAEQLLAAGRKDEAAAIVQSALTLHDKLLSAPRPTLEAMEAVSDLDRIYGKLLISNGYFGEARLLLQKNITRWRTWKPQTPDTERRLKQANDDVAECDKHMGG
jgi:hypothetical protein